MTTLSQFYSATVGKKNANQQGTYPGQCVSLVSQYLAQVYGMSPGAWGNAVDYRQRGTGGSHLEHAGWTWSTDQNFKDGDIIIWGDDPGNWTGPEGHIALWYKGQLYDQNFAGRMTAGLDAFFPEGYLGHWRPPAGAATSSKGGDMTTQEQHDVGTAVYRATLHREPESSAAAVSMGKRLEDGSGNLTPASVIAGIGTVKTSPEWKGQDSKIKGASPATTVTKASVVDYINKNLK